MTDEKGKEAVGDNSSTDKAADEGSRLPEPPTRKAVGSVGAFWAQRANLTRVDGYLEAEKVV